MLSSDRAGSARTDASWSVASASSASSCNAQSSTTRARTPLHKRASPAMEKRRFRTCTLAKRSVQAKVTRQYTAVLIILDVVHLCIAFYFRRLGIVAFLVLSRSTDGCRGTDCRGIDLCNVLDVCCGSECVCDGDVSGCTKSATVDAVVTPCVCCSLDFSRLRIDPFLSYSCFRGFHRR